MSMKDVCSWEEIIFFLHLSPWSPPPPSSFPYHSPLASPSSSFSLSSWSFSSSHYPNGRRNLCSTVVYWNNVEQNKEFKLLCIMQELSLQQNYVARDPTLLLSLSLSLCLSLSVSLSLCLTHTHTHTYFRHKIFHVLFCLLYYYSSLLLFAVTRNVHV